MDKNGKKRETQLRGATVNLEKNIVSYLKNIYIYRLKF